MQKELKNKWISALRSGRYRQGDTYLRSDSNDYCCLGVLLCASGFRWKRSDVGGYLNGKHDDSHGGSDNHTELTAAQLKRFGISGAQMETLMCMNDNSKKSFKEIADYIEREL